MRAVMINCKSIQFAWPEAWLKLSIKYAGDYIAISETIKIIVVSLYSKSVWILYMETAAVVATTYPNCT